MTREPELDALLATWMPTRRWFPAKGAGATVVPVEVVPLGESEGAVVEAHLLRLDAPGATSSPLVHVPLVLEPTRPDATASPHAPADVVGTITRHGQSFVVYDAPGHPAYLAATLGAAHWFEGSDAPADQQVRVDDLAGARVITGEQSNTSVILPGVAGGAILKVLRTVAPGANPDLDVPRALAATGWDGVPRPLAWTAVPAAPGSFEELVLTICSALVPGADDGFERACRAARDGARFTSDAAALGVLVGSLRARLGEAYGTSGEVDATWLLTDLRLRAEQAIADAAPRLDERAPAIAQFHETLATTLAAAARLPSLQRVHGDLHLGQVLHGDAGWRVLDFEGEPLRPVAERTRPDLALRDAAGMLRSFDYAAAVGATRDDGWADDARSAFLDAYRSVGTAPWTPLDDQLLAALELDKALYEVVYEVRNRPSWVEIPLGGVDRLLGPV